MNRDRINIKMAGYLWGILFLLTGCIFTDYQECDPDVCTVSFTFVYEYNRYFEDRLAEEVNHIDLFIYDSDGNLYEHISTMRADISPLHTITIDDLPAGAYTAVAWGNCTGNDNFEYLGIETLDSHTVNLACVEDGAVTDKEPGSFFQAMSQFSAAAEELTVPVEMVKNTNLLRIIVRGMEEEDRLWAEERLDGRVESYNRAYGYDNSWASEELISYIPHHYELMEEEQEVKIEFQLLHMSPQDMDTKITLNFRDSDSRTHSIEEPVIPNLMNQYITPVSRESSEMTFDEYVERYDEFELIFYMEYEDTDNGLVIRIKPWDGIQQPGHL